MILFTSVLQFSRIYSFLNHARCLDEGETEREEDLEKRLSRGKGTDDYNGDEDKTSSSFPHRLLRFLPTLSLSPLFFPASHSHADLHSRLPASIIMQKYTSSVCMCERDDRVSGQRFLSSAPHE